MIKFSRPLEYATMIETLELIARHDYNDLSANPLTWASTMAYLTLGGRIEQGIKLDDVDDLMKKARDGK